MNTSVCIERRQRLARALRDAGGGLAVIPTAPERPRSGDSDHPYRHDSTFHYLTGFDEPEAWLLLDASGRSTLLCREKNPERELWDGKRLGPEAAPSALGVDDACEVGRLASLLPERLADQPAVWFAFGMHAQLPALIDEALAKVRQRSRSGVACPEAERDLGPLLAEMRLHKDADELQTMRRAAQISAGAHARAMRYCAQRFRAHPQGSVREYEIEAELLHEFRRHGTQGPAYTSIVAAGANACVLHYAAADAELRAGELCLIDAGCELDGYASDVTRTFPADGRYTPAQRELYDIVAASQAAAIDATRPGARHRDAHHAAVRVLAQGMLDTGLLARDQVGDLDAVIESAAYRRFYMHGTGHWLGRDVHDVGLYLALDEPAAEESDGRGGRIVRRPSRRLEPGMVVTIEPGIYVRPGPDVPERYWNIGIRIEDDAVVTPSGCELLTRAVPVDADRIEALMREG
ncbi:MAG: aminopeptidase P N-terminal domain-containing protein [Proteobacteria bacterium]|nr:aminopeptidase P N-terminal domain-containing protein [Pseudomonadota bacterium]